MVSNGLLVELSPEEMHIFGGPVRYISLQAVENEDSHTTPFRAGLYQTAVYQVGKACH